MLIFYYAKLNYMAFVKSLSSTETLVSCYMQINFKETQLDMFYMMIAENFVIRLTWYFMIGPSPGNVYSTLRLYPILICTLTHMELSSAVWERLGVPSV